MAITRAQQFRQMLEDGGMLVQPSTTGKRPGYRRSKTDASGGGLRGSAKDPGSPGPSDNGRPNMSQIAGPMSPNIKTKSGDVFASGDLTLDEKIDIKQKPRGLGLGNFAILDILLYLILQTVIGTERDGVN